MISVVFKNLEKSEIAKEAAVDRISSSIEKFPELETAKIVVTLEMENSPLQAGPDLFRVKVRVSGGGYDGLILEKKASSLYVALADVNDHLLERLNRASDRNRVKTRKKDRKTSLRAQQAS